MPLLGLVATLWRKSWIANKAIVALNISIHKNSFDFPAPSQPEDVQILNVTTTTMTVSWQDNEGRLQFVESFPIGRYNTPGGKTRRVWGGVEWSTKYTQWTPNRL